MFAKVIAKPGQRDAVLQNLLAASREPMPGCKMYVVNVAASEPDAVFVYEVWDTQANHDASLAMDNVKAIVEKTKPLIAAFEGLRLEAVGGKGVANN
jgi:quinol monooxygenase YgiN